MVGISGGAAAGAGIQIVIQAIDKFSKPMKQVENGLKKHLYCMKISGYEKMIFQKQLRGLIEWLACI